MAPTLDSSYEKDLSEFPHKGETRNLRFGYILNEASLFKITEIEIIEPEDDNVRYIMIERVGATDHDAVGEFILDSDDADISEQDTIRNLLDSDMLDETKNTVAGRIALRSYSFVENSRDIDCYQVSGVETTRALRQRGLCNKSYLFLLNWYEHLVCDDKQTIPGAKIWAGPLVRTGEVRIYNEKGMVFEDVLGDFGRGKSTGFLPWNKGTLQEYDLGPWRPNELQKTVQKFIVLIISRCTRSPVGLPIE
ncbi:MULTISPECIES: hypothetical protein [Citrobacter]|uniref:hypothetical protein n=1 Tax=Citrobacter TaxID=544 RepID=UPI001902BF19|nr:MULTISPECIES: hypothetical protein [Citrobacter]MBJ8401656.1 hypothetical protein [Citrobacter youngae]MBJ9603556.1 hypothetical protein [Citrobacter sp. FDAARGOS_156]